jgi:nicotinamide-nucleotide amidase
VAGVTGDGRPARATILAIGSELLGLGRTDTNSVVITDRLALLGIEVRSKGVVGDDREELIAALAHALSRNDLVFVTGGLGPTDDDVTRDAVAQHLGLPMDEDPAILAGVRRRFEDRGMRMPEVNRRQAQVPRGATVLPNTQGTAPGLWLRHGHQGIALLPGPPREMRPMLDTLLAAHVAPVWGGQVVRRRALLVAGRSESRVEELVQPLYSTWTSAVPPITTTILASMGTIELHLSATGGDPARLDAALDGAVDALARVLGPDLASRDGQSLEQVVGAQLQARGWCIALAESCTGGLVTSRLTDVAGSSAYVERAVVTYSNRAKTALLGVPEALIAEHGAVSEAVAAAMARGVRERAGVELGVGVTGIAGPGGGSDAKPVGTVCIAVDGPAGARVTTQRFPGGRTQVKTFASGSALDMVRRYLLGDASTPDWARRP